MVHEEWQRADARAARAHARQLAQRYYGKHRRWLSSIPDELFHALLHSLIPDTANAPAAHAGAAELILRLQREASRARDDHCEQQAAAARRHAELLAIKRRLDDLAARLRNGGDVRTARAELAALEQRLHSLLRQPEKGTRGPTASETFPERLEREIAQMRLDGAAMGLEPEQIDAEEVHMRAEYRNRKEND
jgi:hypothetical protein